MGPENFYGIEIPEGFSADLHQAQQKGKCLIVFPIGETFNQGLHALTISLESINPDQTLKEFIKKDLAPWTKKTKGPRIEIEPELTTPQGLTFELRRVFGPSRNLAFMARAYLRTMNQVLLISSAVKKQDEIPLYENVFQTLVAQIRKIEPKDIFSYMKEQAQRDLKTPTGKNYDLRFINSIRGLYLSVLKDCPPQTPPEMAIIRLSQDGKIQNWFDEKASDKVSCLGQKLLGAQGAKAPFEPFHLVLNSSAF